MLEIESYLESQRKRVDKLLAKYLPPRPKLPSELYQAINYSVKSGGKRLRPILTLATGEMFNADRRYLEPTACAIEFIHTYSLIHDDLPAMDNDNFRRGKPTNHKVFGEAIAILAGDALLTYAFEVIATRIKNSSLVRQLVSEISQAAGGAGMVGGQGLDIRFARGTTKSRDNDTFYTKMPLMKTAALIKTAVTCGGIIADIPDRLMAHLKTYGQDIGFAFQLKDDILDGIDGQKAENYLMKSQKLVVHAKRAIQHLGEKSKILQSLADYIIIRQI